MLSLRSVLVLGSAAPLLALLPVAACSRSHLDPRHMSMTSRSLITQSAPMAEPAPAGEWLQFAGEQADYAEKLEALLAAPRPSDQAVEIDVTRRALNDDLEAVRSAGASDWPRVRAKVDGDLASYAGVLRGRRIARVAGLESRRDDAGADASR